MTTAAGNLGDQVDRTPRVAGATVTTGMPAMRGPLGIVSPTWRRGLPAAVAGCDLAGGIVAVLVALRFRFGLHAPDFFIAQSRVSYVQAVLVIALAWPGVLAALGAYRASVVGSGGDEMGRVVEAGLTLFAALAVVHLLLETNLSGRLVALAACCLVMTTLAVRLVVDGVVRRARLRSRWRHRAVVYGTAREASALVKQFRLPALPVDVVGTCVVDPSNGAEGDLNRHTPGGPTDPGEVRGPGRKDRSVGDTAIEEMVRTGASLLAVAGGTRPAEVRELAWALEGTGAELMIAPSVPDLAQQRVVVESVGGVVLLRVEECRQRKGWLLAKGLVDRMGAAALLLALSPVLAAVALAVKRGSAGPVLYRQERVGQHGRTFTFLKFRTMVADAEAQVDDLIAVNETDGHLFKIHDDPRITGVGRVLRRFSLDELPQLWNVLRGDMSLVGPRPLPVDSAVFVGDERRRLRVRPGITGLWQVSGRSDLPWQATVALDMHYVDHWSLGLDLAILARTPLAVLRGRGAY